MRDYVTVAIARTHEINLVPLRRRADILLSVAESMRARARRGGGGRDRLRAVVLALVRREADRCEEQATRVWMLSWEWAIPPARAGQTERGLLPKLRGAAEAVIRRSKDAYLMTFDP